MVKIGGVRSLTMLRDEDARLQGYADKLSGTIWVLAHDTLSGIAIFHYGDFVHRAQVQIPQHVTGRKARDQKFFGVVTSLVASETGITGSGKIRLTG